MVEWIPKIKPSGLLDKIESGLAYLNWFANVVTDQPILIYFCAFLGEGLQCKIAKWSSFFDFYLSREFNFMFTKCFFREWIVHFILFRIDL